VHDGAGAPPTALFNHVFYAQRAQLHRRTEYALRDAPVRPQWPWFVDPSAPVDMGRLSGVFQNQDTFAALA
jgi:hypothetical protein